MPTVFHSELVWRLPSPEKKRFLDPGRAGVKDYNCLLYFFPSHGLTSIQCWEDFRLAEAVMRVVTILRLKTIVTQWLLWKEIKLPVKVCCSQHAVYFWKENIGTLCYWNQAKAIQNSLSSVSFIVRHFKRMNYHLNEREKCYKCFNGWSWEITNKFIWNQTKFLAPIAFFGLTLSLMLNFNWDVKWTWKRCEGSRSMEQLQDYWVISQYTVTK